MLNLANLSTILLVPISKVGQLIDYAVAGYWNSTVTDWDSTTENWDQI